MCRLAAYTGPVTPLRTLLYDGPHALTRQAHSPREMLRGTVNVDGTGLAWWPEGEEDQAPLRYVSERPPWSDPNLPGLTGRLSAVTALAAIRNGSPGVPYGPANVAPFVHGRLACVHNGLLGKFREGVGRELMARLPDHLYGALDTISDSLVVFLTVVRRYEEDPGAGLVRALERGARDVIDVCVAAGTEATLNVVVAAGSQVVAIRTARGTEGNNPLYVLQGGRGAPGGTLLASEPLDDDPGWTAIPDDHVVDLGADGMTMSRFEAP